MYNLVKRRFGQRLNRRLCDSQYADYRESVGFNRAIKLIEDINQKAGDDKAFRLMVLASLLPELNMR